MACDYLEELLDKRDALMDLAEHDKVPWDDEVFTRSRKYFWVIHCLTEFHIGDNILLWENYKVTRGLSHCERRT
jgi:hypothetical protein